MTNIFAEFHMFVKVPQAEDEGDTGSRPRVQRSPVNEPRHPCVSSPFFYPHLAFVRLVYFQRRQTNSNASEEEELQPLPSTFLFRRRRSTFHQDVPDSVGGLSVQFLLRGSRGRHLVGLLIIPILLCFPQASSSDIIPAPAASVFKHQQMWKTVVNAPLVHV